MPCDERAVSPWNCSVGGMRYWKRWADLFGRRLEPAGRVCHRIEYAHCLPWSGFYSIQQFVPNFRCTAAIQHAPAHGTFSFWVRRRNIRRKSRVRTGSEVYVIKLFRWRHTTVEFIGWVHFALTCVNIIREHGEYPIEKRDVFCEMNA